MRLDGHPFRARFRATPERELPTLIPQERPRWDDRLGRHREEFLALAREPNSEMYYSGLLNLGLRLEGDDRLEIAGEIYQYLSTPSLASAAIPSSIRQRAQERLGAMHGTGASGLRTEFLLHRLSREAMEPTALVGLTAASTVFRMTRLASLSRLLASPTGNFFTRGFGARATAGVLGFSAEATAFPLATRLGAVALGRNLDWSGAQLGREVASSFLVLGAMRLAGWGSAAAYARAAGGMNPLVGSRPALQGFVQQAGTLGGIMIGHHLETAVGLRPHLDGATTLVDSLALWLQLSVAGRLSHGMMGRGFTSWERSLDLQAKFLDRSQLPQIRTPWRPLSEGMLSSAAAGPRGSAGRLPIETLGPREADPFEKSSLVMMARGKSSGGEKLNSLPSLLRHTSLFRDAQAAKLALRALWIGVTGPLREEIITTLEKIEAGQPHGLLIRDLLTDPKLAQTRFLSTDLQRRIGAQILELKLGGGGRDSGVFFFNLTRGFIESPPTPGQDPQKPIKLTAEALLPLQDLRLQELENLLEAPGQSLPFTVREALYEGVQVARNYARVIQGLKMRKNRDFLTGLRNREDLGRMTPRLDQRLLNFLKHSEESSLEDHMLMIDIDYFKKVNDTYGHQGGDEVLQKFAEVLLDPEVIRPRDFIFRYGGEEFLIYLFKSGRDGAEIAAERVRRAIEAQPIKIEGHDPIHVTVSIGIEKMRPLSAGKGSLPVIEGALAHSINRADKALLAAKSSGRNRVIFFGDPNIDWPTGIFNYTGLEGQIPRLEAALAATPKSASVEAKQHWVLMFDVDHLDVINFAYGQMNGDKVLWTIAQTFRETLGGIPYVSARYGGDKFFLHLQTSDAKEALEIAERVRKNISHRDIQIEGRDPIHTTVSIGVAEMRLPHPVVGPGAFLSAVQRANQALRAAKKGGRNRVGVSTE